MRAGRNDPCPCGSGKKYKKCCLTQDQETEASRLAQSAPPPDSASPPHPPEAPPPQPPDPLSNQRNARWKEFESQKGEGQVAVFLNLLEEGELMEIGRASCR